MKAKIIGIVDNGEDYPGLWKDLDLLRKRAKELQMDFNFDKCEVAYFAKSYQAWINTIHVRTLGEGGRDMEGNRDTVP